MYKHPYDYNGCIPIETHARVIAVKPIHSPFSPLFVTYAYLLFN